MSRGSLAQGETNHGRDGARDDWRQNLVDRPFANGSYHKTNDNV